MAKQPTQEPTNSEIMVKLANIEQELGKAEKRDRIIAWIALMSVGAGFVAASLVVLQWSTVLIGAAFVVIGLLGVIFKWTVGWRV
jgi:hypothetical protein